MAYVLLVEDDVRCVVPMRIGLQRLGHRVEVADNGKEALAWIEGNGEPEAILLDLFMPIMTGYDFLRIYEGKAPVIVLSGWADHEDPITKTRVIGALRKPVCLADIQDLLSKLPLSQ